MFPNEGLEGTTGLVLLVSELNSVGGPTLMVFQEGDFRFAGDLVKLFGVEKVEDDFDGELVVLDGDLLVLETPLLDLRDGSSSKVSIPPEALDLLVVVLFLVVAVGGLLEVVVVFVVVGVTVLRAVGLGVPSSSPSSSVTVEMRRPVTRLVDAFCLVGIGNFGLLLMLPLGGMPFLGPDDLAAVAVR